MLGQESRRASKRCLAKTCVQIRVTGGVGVASKPFENMVGVQTAAVMMLVLVGAGAQLSERDARLRAVKWDLECCLS